MLRLRVTAAAFGGFLWLSAFAAPLQKSLSASDAWIRLPATGDTSARGFVVIENPTMYDVYFVSATAEIADAIQFRDGAGGGDGAVIKELTAPAYGRIELKPGGTHLVLSRLRRTLKAGDVISITISTETEAITVNATVKP